MESTYKRNAADARRWRALMAILSNERNRVDEVRVDQGTVLHVSRETAGAQVYNGWRIYLRSKPV